HRLYLPSSWTEDEERLTAAGVPEQVEFATKPELARQMIAAALEHAPEPGWPVTRSTDATPVCVPTGETQGRVRDGDGRHRHARHAARARRGQGVGRAGPGCGPAEALGWGRLQGRAVLRLGAHRRPLRRARGAVGADTP